MRKVLKDSGRPCAEKTVSPKLTVVSVFVFWTFKYLQEIFVQFWVQHGDFGLHVFVQHQGKDGKHGVDGGVPEDVSHCLLSGSAAKRTITGATTFPFSPSWISTELKHRGNAREKQQPRALGQPGLIPACISPDRQESLVERHRSEVENGGEDSLGTHRGDTHQGDVAASANSHQRLEGTCLHWTQKDTKARFQWVHIILQSR